MAHQHTRTAPRKNVRLAATLLGLCLAAAGGSALADGAPKVIKKVAPEFPDEAVRRGVDRGVLKLKISVDATGKPTEVSVLDVQPGKAKMLNTNVTEAVNQWRFAVDGKPATFELQMVLSAE